LRISSLLVPNNDAIGIYSADLEPLLSVFTIYKHATP
jgi:hypothetical protein